MTRQNYACEYRYYESYLHLGSFGYVFSPHPVHKYVMLQMCTPAKTEEFTLNYH